MICEETPWGIWLKFPDGKSRYAIKGSELYARVKEGLAPIAQERGTNVTVYFQNPDGSLGVPPTADTPIPADAVRLEARTLTEQDALGRALAQQEHRKWEGSVEMNEMMEQSLDSPRKKLVDKLATGQVKGNTEREVIRRMIADLDKEEHNRSKISTNFYVHSREF